jgi:hypothetical protein
LTDRRQCFLINLDNGHRLSRWNAWKAALILVEQKLPGRFEGVRKRLVHRTHESRTVYVARPFAGQVDEAQAEQHHQCHRAPLGCPHQTPDARNPPVVIAFHRGKEHTASMIAAVIGW